MLKGNNMGREKNPTNHRDHHHTATTTTMHQVRREGKIRKSKEEKAWRPIPRRQPPGKINSQQQPRQGSLHTWIGPLYMLSTRALGSCMDGSSNSSFWPHGSYRPPEPNGGSEPMVVTSTGDWYCALSYHC